MPDKHEPPAAVDQARCIECGVAWTDGAERWRLYLSRESGRTVCLLYCAECAAREFD